MRSSRLGACALLLGLAGAAFGFALPAAAEDPSLAITPAAVVVHWGYVVGRNPRTTSLYTPGPKDQGHVGNAPATIQRQSAGRYFVTFPGLGSSGIDWHVTPLESARYCVTWDSGTMNGGADEYLIARCYTRSDIPADTKFSANFLESSAAGKVAYGAATDTTPSSQYLPSRQYDSAGGTITATNHATAGSSTIRMPNLHPAGGNVQVTSTDQGATCRALGWGPVGTGGADLSIDVQCRNLAGAQSWIGYEVTFTQGVGLQGVSGRPAAYLFSNLKQPPANYHPPAQFRFSTAHLSSIVNRTGLGTYAVTLPGMPAGGAAQVTAFGAGKARCNLASIRTVGTPQQIGVRCMNVAGNPADSQFTLSYLK